MTCDDAFDQLTSPGGASNPRLAAHLARCTRCRGMAETLSPAIELFSEPGRAGSPPSNASLTAIAEQSAARLAQRVPSTRRPRSKSRQGVRILVAVVGGAACCLIAMRLGSSNASPSAASCPRKSPAATEWMERNALPVAMACIACHPAGGQLGPAPLRPASSLGRTL